MFYYSGDFRIRNFILFLYQNYILKKKLIKICIKGALPYYLRLINFSPLQIHQKHRHNKDLYNIFFTSLQTDYKV